MAEAIVSLACETLWDLLIEKVDCFSGVSIDLVDEVDKKLQLLRSFLEDADRKQFTSQEVRRWIAEVRALLAKAEDVLEEYAIQVAYKSEEKKLKKILKRFTNCISFECVKEHRIGKEIKKIMYRFADLEYMRMGYDIPGISSSIWEDDVEPLFVGRTEDIKRLESLLTSTNDGSNIQAISICGIGGVGKTSLATRLYNMETVRSCFDACAWINVGPQFVLTYIFRDLLEQLLPQDRVGEDELEKKVLSVLREKTCLVVLDDIWRVDLLEDMLGRIFSIGEGRCRILLTSRHMQMPSAVYVHELKGLEEDEGWELLQKKSFPPNYDSTEAELPANELQQLEEIGREMIAECGYLPLAISALGGTLRIKERRRVVWEMVRDDIDALLARGGNLQVKQILDLSYNMLPYNLKKCFLYLGCFPEDEEIYTEQLYLLWIAERMISPKDRRPGETLREVAKRYLSELADRCMVQVEMDDNSIKSCRLHDLMRDLCLSKWKEEGFKDADTYDMRRVHLHIKGDDCNLRPSSNLRSLWFTRKEWTPRNWNVNLVSNNIGIYKFLKILVLEGCKFENRKLPKGIEKLTRLKHLSIKSSVVDDLPTSICKLPCLQHLNLQTYSTIRMPNCINKLRRLRDLLLLPRRSVVGGQKLELGGLNELETMVGFDSSLDDTAGLINMMKLRELLDASIHDEDSLLKIVNHILHQQDQFREASLSVQAGCNLINSEVDGDSTLLKKTLLCYSLSRLEIKCCFRKLPAYQPQLGKNLLYLRLENCCITEDPMETLENLPKLECLIFSINAYMGREMVCRANGFPQLKNLMLFNLGSLVKWRVEENAMSNLSFLYISGCNKLEKIPEGLKFISTLEKINIASMPREFMDRAREVEGLAGEDFDTIKHIPSVQFFTSSNPEAAAAMFNAAGVSNG